MNKLFLISLLIFISYSAKSQEVTVLKYDDKGRKGYKVVLQSEATGVNDFINSYFKETGKVKSRSGVYSITGLSRADFPFQEVTIFSETQKGKNNTTAVAWMADSLMSDNKYASKLESMWYNFGIDFYKHLVQREIDESNQALRFAEKQYQRLDKDSLNLQNDLINNRKEKLKLEEALKTNALNYEILLDKVEQNTHNKDSVLTSIDKIKKLIELQQAKKDAIK